MSRQFEVIVSNIVHTDPSGNPIAQGALIASMVAGPDTVGMRADIERCALEYVKKANPPMTLPVTLTVELRPVVIE